MNLSLRMLELHDPHAVRRGRQHRYLCPFSECQAKQRGSQHRSLAVNSETGQWICHRCEQKGVLQEFRPGQSVNRDWKSHREWQQQQLQERFSVASNKAGQDNPHSLGLKWPRERFTRFEGLFKRAQDQWKQGCPAAQYLQSRGIPFSVAENVCGFASEWREGNQVSRRVVFPISNQAGSIVAIQGRAIDSEIERPHLTLGPKSEGVFLTSASVLRADPVFICEAPIDALSLAAASFSAMATVGKSWPQWLPKFLAFRRVGVAYDADSSGDEAALDLQHDLERFGAFVFRVSPPVGKDWNEVLVRQGQLYVNQHIECLIPRLIGYKPPAL